MALPYLLLSAFPSYLRFLPKPGPWMTTFKPSSDSPCSRLSSGSLGCFSTGWRSVPFILLSALLLLSFAAWIYGHYCTAINSKNSRRLGGSLALACAAIAFYGITFASMPGLAESNNTQIAALTEHEEGSWEPYSAQRVTELQEQGIPVLIDFTAKWCLICQVNHLTLCTSEVTQKMKELNVVKMKADWTRNDPNITEALRSYGRNGVPLYVLNQCRSIETSADPTTSTNIGNHSWFPQ